MSAETDALLVANKIKEIYLKRKLAGVFALAKAFEAQALEDFFNRQLSEEFWQNQTGQALARVFGFAFKRKDAIGFRVAHGVEYGVYLERANDRKHEAIRPIVFEWGKRFIDEARKLLA